MSKIALCADAESLKHPNLIGLEGEALLSQSWLLPFSSADEARRGLKNNSEVGEVWVASCDDMDSVNLAAALKQDNPLSPVRLVAFQGSGSLFSRAQAAHIDEVLTKQTFPEHYAKEKRRRSVLPAVSACNSTSSSNSVLEQPAKESATVTTAQVVEKPSEKTSFLQEKGKRTFLFSVVSGSGGAGKSTVSVLLAILAQRKGYKTLLLDFDLQFGDAKYMLGVGEALTSEEVLRNPARICDLKPTLDKPALLAAPAHLEQAEYVIRHAGKLLDMLSDKFEVIVVNTGAFWNDEHAILLERSSRTLFLIDQRASSLRTCKHAIELCARCGIATTPFLFVANRVARGSLFTSIDISCALGGASAAEIAEGGPEVEELLGVGLPQDLINENNNLVVSLEKLLNEIIPQAQPGSSFFEVQSQPKGLFGKYRSRRRRGEL